MARVTFILGLAGSGKSYLAKAIVASSGAKVFEGTEGGQRDLLLPALIHHLKGGGDCVVEEIAYCVAEFREKIASYIEASVSGVEIEWICYENNLESANWNVVNRANKSAVAEHMEINRQYHPLYTYPQLSKVVRITRVAKRRTDK